MTRFAFLALLLLLALAGAVRAQDDHGHDHGPSAAAAGPASPRVVAASDLFELVGIVEHDVMTIYLDRADSNAPVVDAKIEVEATLAGGSEKPAVEPQPDGSYRLRAAWLETPGQYALAFTVSAGGELDILAGNLQIAATDAAHADGAAAALPWPWLAAAVAVSVLLAGLLLRRRRRTATALLALAAAALVVMATPPARAGEGHDHGDSAAAAGGNSPRRLPGGDVFLPKPSQRQLVLRTAVAAADELPRTVMLMGRVVMDPNAGGKVQPTVAGRIEPGPRGLPNLGQRVRRGEVLARVRSAAGSIERANQNAGIAELQVAQALAERRLARLRQLEGSVSQREIEQAQAEADSAARRLAAVTAVDASVEQLVAPVGGVIAAVHAVAGQVVDAREVVFEIVDPARLRIEATAFDAALAAGITGAAAAPVMPARPQAGESSIPLTLIGAGRTQVEGGFPIQFAATGRNPLPLVVGQPVRVFAHTAARVRGVPLPAGAVVKSPSNEDIVWVKEDAETFTPRPVRFEPVDGATVVVLSGVQPGERVVVQAAPLLNQVR